MTAGFNHTATGKGFYKVSSPQESEDNTAKQTEVKTVIEVDEAKNAHETPEKRKENNNRKKVIVMQQNSPGRDLTSSPRATEELNSPGAEIQKFNNTANSFYRKTTGTFASSNGRNVPQTAQ